MNRPLEHFFRFLGAIRRRLMVVRLMERIGLAILIACGPALLITALLIWRGQPTLTIAEVFIATGFIAGIAWAILRRPTALAAALEADRQLKLAELLSSAWLCWRGATYRHDTWSATLLTEADARCAEFSPSSLTLRRLGGRTWGAVVLAIGLLVTVALLGPSSEPSGTNGTQGRSKTSLALGGVKNDGHKGESFTTPDNRPILLPDPDDLNASQFGQEPIPQASQAAKAAADSIDSLKSDNHAAPSSGSAGLGKGSAQTKPPADAAKPQLVIGHAGGGLTSADKTADQGNGAGDAIDDAANKNAAGASGGAMAGSSPRSAAPPPWKAADWPSTIHRAQIALDAGSIPPAYRDLVRGYFSVSAE